MGAGLKKDLRVSSVGPGGSLNAFFFLLIGVLSQRLATEVAQILRSESSQRESRRMSLRCRRRGLGLRGQEVAQMSPEMSSDVDHRAPRKTGNEAVRAGGTF
ncbi:hypothetical protein E3N88_31686 [Mikania micrantha]|uniref:Uncharacterized protein n=1 Tax=Mikania micrantha TaxID=192012 RepID=A0A5N6M6W5_9ASTR|nr:hypothetical protein E3N88_31686 [Mikania micrantha]